MITINLQKEQNNISSYFFTSLNLVILFFAAYFISANLSLAADNFFSSSGIGTVNARVFEATIDTNAIDADLNYENLNNTSVKGDADYFDVSNLELTEGLFVREKNIYINSKPNTFVGIAYGKNAFSKKDNFSNKEGYALVTLQNSLGSVMTVKIKIDKLAIFFDKNGKGELKIVSEFFMNNAQFKGTYRGYYQMIIFY